ncbi:DegT/DnrJ/EryC1/StrS family aminotransferase [Haladaptatus sp. DYF46]|uniref:DegT/DnrJ/EryC1/StrS family aminotransferase n=1 Tax=Haladaptatus sp. DYF46 TaxID=2886041 RepID=UPI001E5425E2|nr:DegT/DnrJ/EryC1/StrS family aminotransferase [Haladaptatus sp. DYF46]
MISIANPQMGPEEKDGVLDILDSGMLADGPEVRAFEDEFSAYCDAKHGIATSNGTTALHTMFEAFGIGDGDHVVTSPFSFVASANAIRLTGAEPVFADIDAETYTLDPKAVEETVREQDIDAILAVHLYGLPAAMEQLREIANEYHIPLLEDAAQAHGAEYQGSKVGSIGDAACFSFYPTKNMTTGEGGMITTDRVDIADHASSFINHGRTTDGGYEHVRLGHNFRMTSIAAAIGRVQLEKLPQYIDARRSNAAALDKELCEASVLTPTEPDNARHVYHQYTIRTDDREGLSEYLQSNDVGTGVYYPVPIHKQAAYDGYGCSAAITERVSDKVLSLPVHPELSDSDIETITNTILDYEENK